MAFKVYTGSPSYLSYDEYKNLGGVAPEEAFQNLERKARHYLDYITFDRIKHLTKIPIEVKEVMVDFIDKISDYETQQSSDAEGIAQYSNGVETITYKKSNERTLKQSLYTNAIQWLPDYLVNRSVKFDVKKYLQSESNDS